MNSVYKIPPPHVGTAGQEFLNRSKVQTSNDFLFAFSSRGNMGDFPISSGGGQFAFVPLSLWYKFATRGCRWICYSNCQSNPSKAQNIFETLFALDWRMQIMFQICFRLFLGGEILAQRPHVGGGIFHTEFIQICTIFGVDFDKKQHIHQIL